MFWVDTFAWEVVDAIEENAPPERYYEFRKGTYGVIIETYIASYNPLKLIDFAYTVGTERELLGIQRKIYLEKHGVSANAQLYAYTVPPSWFENAISKLKEMEGAE